MHSADLFIWNRKSILLIGINIIMTSALIAQNFTYRIYTIKDGLPCSTINGIKTDSRGYLWISSVGGLSRFDGTTFKNYSTREVIPSGYEIGIDFEDKQGRLWIHYVKGVFCFDGVHFKEYPIENPPPGLWICQVMETHDHKMRFFTKSGIYELQNEKWKRLNLFSSETNSFDELNDSTMLISCFDSLVLYYKSGYWNTVARTGIDDDFLGPHKAKNGKIYVSSRNHLYIFEDNHLKLIYDDVLSHKKIHGLYVDKENRLWIGTQQHGLYIFTGNKVQHILEGKCGYICEFDEDYEGNIWATSFNGLIKLSPSWVDFYDNGLHGKNATAIRNSFKDKDGTIYFGNTVRGFTKLVNHKFISSEEFLDKSSNKLISNWVCSFVIDEKKNLWVTDNEESLIKITGSHAENLSNKWNQLISRSMTYNSFDSSIYAGFDHGIVKVKNDKYQLDTIPGFE